MILYGERDLTKAQGNPGQAPSGGAAVSVGDGQPMVAEGIVERAVAVLARQITEKPSAVSVPASLPQSLIFDPSAIEALLKQAREWIDKALAAAAGGGLPVSVVAEPVRAAVEHATGTAPTMASRAIPVLAAVGAATPGDIIKLPLRLMNEAGVEAPLSLAATDLLAESGHRILASAISFWPDNPFVKAGGPAVVEVNVTVPPGTPAGQYAGLIQVIGHPDARTLVSIKVT